ncbi:hypothetical protein K443DRAFT_617705 [Laccaria amethystina LaAM-08-1]|uniref:Unplaced genomic scaffold K443scaffold_97, whole genome shotgun sequence n=1 Tax=Laccaria amethystina LaAM-08-1 TaxID=1095629 RepID=A0A0C9XW50_9AGAR|nr:hypothetical protein K443DRAFT_617705 [Laccaria amethystina LaAM-08-1]
MQFTYLASAVSSTAPCCPPMSTLTSQDVLFTPHPGSPFIFILISGVTCMGYDYLLKLRREISYIWSCPWSVGIALFYISRYLMFIDQPLYLYLYVQLIPGSPNTCSVLLSIALISMSMGFLSSQMIISLRTCAMWGRQRWILAMLGTLTLVRYRIL